MLRPDSKAADAYMGLRPFFLYPYILRAGYVLRARGLEPGLRGGAGGMSEIQVGLILLGIIVVVLTILGVWIAVLGG
jgi:hypothetical protein